MSNPHSDLVWAHSAQTDKAFTAMLYLAKIADKETGCGFIKPETLAEKIRISTERYARLILDRLEAAGEIAITETRGKTRYFQITLTALPHSAEPEPVAEPAEAAEPAATGSPDPQIGSHDPSPGSPDPTPAPTGSYDPPAGSHDPAFLLDTDLNTDLDTDTPPIIPPSTPKKGRKQGVFVPPPTSADKEFPFQNGRKSKHPDGECDRRIAAILEVCGLDRAVPDHLREAERGATQLAKYTGDYIRQRYGPGGWWQTHDFRGRRGDQPTVDWLISTIAKSAPITTNGRHADDLEAMKARVAAKLQEAKNVPRLAQ
jgi:hypothetical protein